VTTTTLAHSGQYVLSPLAGRDGGLRPDAADATITAGGPSPHPSEECNAVSPAIQQWQCKSDYIKKMFLGFSCFGSSPTLQAAAN